MVDIQRNQIYNELEFKTLLMDFEDITDVHEALWKLGFLQVYNTGTGPEAVVISLCSIKAEQLGASQQQLEAAQELYKKDKEEIMLREYEEYMRQSKI